ncbi:hypothetical protein RCCGEPOP_17378 [Rhizobium sp. Pop5]|nr:hypothetical protein RCCGEPOP_17378 [Rhizobium sp. Pop5]
MARFYLLAIEPTLFGGSSLMRCWGRIGTKGQSKIDLFDTGTEATEAFGKLVRSKLKRGYWRNAPGQCELQARSEPVGRSGARSIRILSRDKLGNQIA